MESDSVAVAVVSALGAVVLEFMRRGVKQLAAAKTAAAATLKQITDGQRADAARALEALVVQARTEVQLMAEIAALRTALEDAVESRRRDNEQVLAQMRDVEAKLETVIRQMANYDEFRKNPVYRSNKSDT